MATRAAALRILVATDGSEQARAANAQTFHGPSKHAYGRSSRDRVVSTSLTGSCRRRSIAAPMMGRPAQEVRSHGGGLMRRPLL